MVRGNRLYLLSRFYHWISPMQWVQPRLIFLEFKTMNGSIPEWVKSVCTQPSSLWQSGPSPWNGTWIATWLDTRNRPSATGGSSAAWRWSDVSGQLGASERVIFPRQTLWLTSAGGYIDITKCHIGRKLSTRCPQKWFLSKNKFKPIFVWNHWNLDL